MKGVCVCVRVRARACVCARLLFRTHHARARAHTHTHRGYLQHEGCVCVCTWYVRLLFVLLLYGAFPKRAVIGVTKGVSPGMLKGGDRDGGDGVCGVCGVAHLDAGPPELRVDHRAGAPLGRRAEGAPGRPAGRGPLGRPAEGAPGRGGGGSTSWPGFAWLRPNGLLYGLVFLGRIDLGGQSRQYDPLPGFCVFFLRCVEFFHCGYVGDGCVPFLFVSLP